LEKKQRQSMIHRARFSLVIILFLSSFISAQKFTSFEVNGNFNFDDSEYLKWSELSINQPIYNGILDSVKSKIARNILLQGYYYFDFSSAELITSNDSTKFGIILNIVEGDPVLVNNIFIDGIDTTLNMKPEEFRVKKNEMETYVTPDLNEEIRRMKSRGVNSVAWEIEKHKRMATPFSTFILTLIGVGLASRKVKGGLGFHLGLGLALSFSYILFMQVSTVFAVSGTVPVVVAMWIPNILYSVIAFFVFRWASK